MLVVLSLPFQFFLFQRNCKSVSLSTTNRISNQRTMLSSRLCRNNGRFGHHVVINPLPCRFVLCTCIISPSQVNTSINYSLECGNFFHFRCFFVHFFVASDKILHNYNKQHSIVSTPTTSSTINISPNYCSTSIFNISERCTCTKQN